MSDFDPNTFLDATVSEPNEKRPPLPENNPADPSGLYTAVVGPVTMESGTISKGERSGQPWLSAIIPLKIEVPPQLQDELKFQPQITISDRAFIDLTPNRTIDNSPGKNRRQRMYRDALDLNKPGDEFNWRKVEGQVLKVKIKHEMYEGTPQERIEVVLRG